MLREEGVVVAVEGEYAIVANQRRGGCGGCHAEASCGALSAGSGRQSVGIRARNPLHAEVGERVVLEIAEGAMLRASFLVYGLPILALVLVGVVARSLARAWGIGDSESVGALAGLLALAGTFYGLYLYNQRIENDERHQPVIARVLSSVAGHAGVCS
ncbi:SoxR reducing system RseC family protein [Candidatus Magnetaquicoccus inordinatus]|uniref:SoxR reducing system RseC family protein n=1 Tax=Candidatus Magnetaquicoccus inordinatus TaxID=2496818 RepID=UPI00102B3F51|nr:SoxR reducing system RseC family protein [Candidatus Magnetaquicoccus inordinatus]